MKKLLGLSHLELLLSLVKTNIIRKINFILQEIHREINTIGSKSDNIRLVIQLLN